MQLQMQLKEAVLVVPEGGNGEKQQKCSESMQAIVLPEVRANMYDILSLAQEQKKVFPLSICNRFISG